MRDPRLSIVTARMTNVLTECHSREKAQFPAETKEQQAARAQALYLSGLFLGTIIHITVRRREDGIDVAESIAICFEQIDRDVGLDGALMAFCHYAVVNWRNAGFYDRAEIDPTFYATAAAEKAGLPFIPGAFAVRRDAERGVEMDKTWTLFSLAGGCQRVAMTGRRLADRIEEQVGPVVLAVANDLMENSIGGGADWTHFFDYLLCIVETIALNREQRSGDGIPSKPASHQSGAATSPPAPQDQPSKPAPTEPTGPRHPDSSSKLH